MEGIIEEEEEDEEEEEGGGSVNKRKKEDDTEVGNFSLCFQLVFARCSPVRVTKSFSYKMEPPQGLVTFYCDCSCSSHASASILGRYLKACLIFLPEMLMDLMPVADMGHLA